MKPIIIPVENGKVTFTLAEFRKYMEEAYSQGYSDGCSTGTITNAPNDPYWWRVPYCNLSATTTSDAAPEATLTNVTCDNNPNVVGSTLTNTIKENNDA